MEQVKPEGKIFISYRRDDSAYAAGRLYDRLREHFGEENIFMDVEGLQPGEDFVSKLEQSVSACDVLIALIGQKWLTVKGETGTLRLENPEDFVRLEIAAALNRKIRVIPILIEGAHMPHSGELPDDLHLLARLNAFKIRHERFNADADRLVRSIEDYLIEEAERCKQEAAEKFALEQADRDQREWEAAQHQARIAESIRIADAALKREDWKAAQRNFHKALELDPDNLIAQSGLQNAIEGAEQAVVKLREQEEAQRAARVEDYIAMAEVALKRKDWKKAQNYFQNALDLQPENLAAQTGLQNAHGGEERAEKQQREREAVQLQTRIEEDVAKADAAMRQADWETARNYYRKVLDLQPEHTEAQIGLRTAFERLELAQLYGQALIHQDGGELSQTLNILKRIRLQENAYRDVPEWIDKLEAILGEESEKKPKHSFEIFQRLPRQIWYLGGFVSLILFLVLAYWGTNRLFHFLGNPDYFPTTTPTAAVQSKKESEAISPTVPETPLPSQMAEVGPTLFTDDFGVPMALVPAGTFEMGNNNGEGDEKPVHKVRLAAFYIDQYEVMNARYSACVQAGVCNPPLYTYSATRGNYFDIAFYSGYPVIYVTWSDANTYCKWRGARLPTEAEWEKAARGGLEAQLFPWGNASPSCLDKKQNGAQFDICGNDTEVIGNFAPNGYEIYDMAGNVLEWTADWYDVYPGGDTGSSDIFGEEVRVVRGGSWQENSYWLGVARRFNLAPDDSNNHVGFRCARDADQ